MLHNQNPIPFLVPPPSCLSVFFKVVVVVVDEFLEDVTAMTRCNRQALITTIGNIIVCARDAVNVKQMNLVGLGFLLVDVVADVVVVVVDVVVETFVVVDVADFFIVAEVVVVDLCQNFALVPP